jgi:hypothetical protein
MRQPIIGSSPNWPRKSRDAPCVWFDRAGRNQLVVTRCGPLRSRFRSDPVGMSRCPHAAAPPSSVMNSRRRMCALKSRDRTYHIVDAKNALCVTAKLIGQCRRWVQSRHFGCVPVTSGLPQLRTWRCTAVIDVMCQQRTHALEQLGRICSSRRCRRY